jgi:DNA-directed RNA polymerase specialized sigma24 family protein
MVAATADPFGEIAGRWSRLSRADRDRHSRRLVGVGLADARIEDPDAGCYRQYAALVAAALDGDQVAFGWLAESHRPLLLSRGRVLFDRDPTEWSSASLEVLLTALQYAHGPTPGPWLRRQVAQQICHRLGRIVRRELARYRAERACDPFLLTSFECGVDADPHPQLTDALEDALGQLDTATSAGLQAVAMQLPLAAVAAAHDLTHAALKQRLVRARRQLRPQLAAFARTA